MANCPRCTREIRWDACQDAFAHVNEDGSLHHYLKEKPVDHPTEPETEIRFIYCDCGEIIGIWYVSPENEVIFNHQEFSNIDWVDENNSL